MIIYLISGLLGLTLGSFANVCIYRLPLDKSIVTPRSYCPQCQKTLPWWLNIPLLSYVALRGRCFHCKHPISIQYPIIEASMALLFTFHAWFFYGSLPQLWTADVLGFYLLVISVIDYRHRIIPDELSISLLGIGLLSAFANPMLGATVQGRMIHSLSAGLGGGFLMFALAWLGEIAFKKEALGGGDIKLIAATGALLGWRGVAGPLFIGSILGGLCAFLLLLMKRKQFGETLPFGPFLSLGAYITCLYPGLLIFLAGFSL